MIRSASTLAILVLIVLPACGYRFAQTSAPSDGYFESTSSVRANATMKDAQDKTVGLATFRETRLGVLVEVSVRDLPPGQHGIHVHAVSKCDKPDFTTAGAHFNPYSAQHGTNNPQGPHAGDLPNLVVGQDGVGKLSYVDPFLSLAPGAPNSLLGGTALVIHKDPDDEKTDPSGNSGPRIACGTIARIIG